MNACDYNPYELPTITFVGGETRDLAFHIYHYIGKRPYSLSECECTFSLVNFTTKGGKPILLYVCGQSLNLALTLLMAWIMFYKVFPEITAKI